MIDEQEIEALSRDYGRPLRRQVELAIGAELFVTRFLRMGDRRGEVVLALERPGGQLLLHRKAHYGEDTYRLLSGGIGHDEAIAAAAMREAAEETGLQVEICHFIAVIESTLCFGDIRLPFVSYVLHVRETGGWLSADSPEIAGFREVLPGDLPIIAANLRAVPAERGDWGRWRAVAHDIVAEYFLTVNWELSIVNGYCRRAEAHQETGSFPDSGIDNSQFTVHSFLCPESATTLTET